jgi:predicted membrane-bound spermidine synthase
MQIEPADRKTGNIDNRVAQGAADASALEEIASPISRSSGRPPLLLPIVFVSGVAVMATQMGASRLVQPYFGSSLLIWSNLIGLTMVCLALGYFLGGRLADRFPRPAVLYQLTGLAALATALCTLLSSPVLSFTGDLFKDVPGGLFFGSLAGMIILFVIPLTLSGCVSPFAVRLLIKNIQGAGRTAGVVSSTSTVGSILGTFLPVLWIMPTIGTHATMYLFAALLLVFSLVGYYLARQQPAISRQLSAVSYQPSATSDSNPQPQIPGLSTPFLLPIIFICGMVVMATEMLASRLIQPYFGDSQLIWACVIGLIIIYLAIGYYLGGRLGDRFPAPSFLYQLIGVAALCIGLIPVLSTPILGMAQQGFKTGNGFLFFGSLFGIILLFAIPVILLGCVSPFSVRLLVNTVQGTGRTAGKVSSISTAGSILGVFLPVLLFIPTVGTRTTLYIFSLTLMAFAVLGLFGTARRRAPVFAALLVAIAVMSAVLVFKVKTPPYGTLLYDKESAYNYIQVVERDNIEPKGQIDLVLNEGHAIHSIYNPNQVLTGGPWDYFMITPFFNKGRSEKDVKSAMVIGLGAGTVPKQLTKAYGDQIKIDGIEIDPEIIAAGRKYFAMTEPNLNVIAQDGRYGLVTSGKKYDIIGVDAYKQPYIPFHLATKEFFQQVRDHLTPDGVAVINAGTPSVAGKTDYRLAEALAQTMKTVYPNVYLINVSGYFNTMVVATNQPTDIATFKQNIQQYVSNDLIKQVGLRALKDGNIREWTGKSSTDSEPPVFTDDWAPIERIIDQVIIDYVVAGGY